MQMQPLSFVDFRQGVQMKAGATAEAQMPAEPELVPPPPSYGQAELDAAVARAREDGIAEGRAAERAAIDAEAVGQREMLSALATQLIGQLETLRGQAGEAQRALQARIPEMALALGKSLAGHALRHYPADGLMAMIRETSELLQLPPDGFRLEASSKTIAALERHPQVQALSELTVVANDAIPLGDGTLRWQGGHAEHDIAACVSRLESLLQSFTAEPLDAAATNAS